MDERVARTMRSISNFDGLAQFESNARERNALSDEIKEAIKQKSIELGRKLIAERTELDVQDLSPAEEKIVEAVSEYVGVMKRQGKDATRTFTQLRNRGFIEAAEAAVARSKPTQGFMNLAEADLEDLSYEKIIVDHPEEFSARALWYSRRTLGLENDTSTPPTKSVGPVQTWTEILLGWLRERADANAGLIPPFTNAEAAAVLGMEDTPRHARVFGNIQSRIDHACYRVGLPPLGLTATAPFDKAWNQGDRNWAYPIVAMQAAARAHVWTHADFGAVLKETEGLPGQAHIIWKSGSDVAIRAWAFGFNAAKPPDLEDDEDTPTKRNPTWSRDELILALDLYLRFRTSPPGKDSSEVADLSALLNKIRNDDVDVTDPQTYRNANGVYMKMMNFRRFDPEYTSEGKVGLTRGNKLEEGIWSEFAAEPAKLAEAVAAIRAGRKGSSPSGSPGLETPYWVFVCNPKKWNIDRFFDRNIEHDTWGIRPSDRHRFAPGQLGIVRVGVDSRTAAERNGNPPLEPGIYALCEVESEAFDGTGAGDEFWAPGAGREPGWPTVRIRYVKVFRDNPLTIERMRNERPNLSPLLLNGFQAASFPMTSADFNHVLQLLDYNADDLPTPEPETATGSKLSAVEQKYLRASPEVKERVSKTIERGPVGNFLKKEVGFKCQLCNALGLPPLSFRKPSGEHYVEAHHVMPVSKKQIGSLSTSNVMILCANHHRQLHYGGVLVYINEKSFDFSLDGMAISILRHGISASEK